MADCVFCKIIAKEIPSTMVFENEEIAAFNDINPRAKTHVLIVSKKHIPTIMDLKEEEADEVLAGQMILAARNIAQKKGLTGYQLKFHVGKEGGQEVFHIHLHLLSDQPK